MAIKHDMKYPSLWEKSKQIVEDTETAFQIYSELKSLAEDLERVEKERDICIESLKIIRGIYKNYGTGGIFTARNTARKALNEMRDIRRKYFSYLR